MRPGESERDLAYSRMGGSLAVGLLILFVATVLAWPAQYIVSAPSMRVGIAGAGQFFQLLFSDPVAIFGVYEKWFWSSWRTEQMIPWAWVPGIVAFAAVFLVQGILTNPYAFDLDEFGSARWMRWKDLKQMRLLAPTGIILGRWRNSWKLIRNWETLSALIIAPPGTAKTVQLIANILADWPDTRWLPAKEVALLKYIPILNLIVLPIRVEAKVRGPSMIINDPKGEIYDVTAGWRSSLGPVFRLSWGDAANSHRWNPIGPLSYPGGEDLAATRISVIDQISEIFVEPNRALPGIMRAARDGRPGVWVRENLIGDTDEGTSKLESAVGRLQEGCTLESAAQCLEGVAPEVIKLQSLNSQREKHLDRMATILIPDTIEAHWRNTGRTFLTGATGYIMAHCERLGVEPSFGKLLDELTTTTVNGGGFRDPQEVVDGGLTVPGMGSEQDPSGGDGDDDMIAKVLQSWIDESEEFGYPDRVTSDLQETLIKPDRERGSVISTAGSAINIFKNAEVRAVTSTSDFSLNDLREINGMPATYYLVVSLEDAEYLGRLTGLFKETGAAFAISQPSSVVKKSRPLIFIADEFWTMPPLQALLQIPALGRGQRVQLITVGQSFGQIAIKYRQTGGDQTVKILRSSSSYIMTMTQNDHGTAKEISESIGHTTKKQKSIGKQGFDPAMFFGQGKGSGRTINESYKGEPLLRPDEIMSMEKLDPTKNAWGWQIVQVTGAMNRPIALRPVAWFKHPVLKKRGGLPIVEYPEIARSRQEAALPGSAAAAAPERVAAE